MPDTHEGVMPDALKGDAYRSAIETVWRIESARLIGGLVRIVRDVGVAEDLAQDALVAALEQWPESGIPRNPGAWLMQAAKRRAIDLHRHRAIADRKHEEIGRSMDDAQPAVEDDLAESLDDDIGDDLLRLLFVACHPVLSVEARVALTLRLLGGLTTTEIARAFLTPEPTIAQRIVRAKRGSPRSLASFTSSSTRVTRPPRGTTGCDPRYARTRSGWDASWPAWCLTTRRCTAWWR